MWEFFLKNNRFSILLIIALLGLGVFSVLSIAKESSPEVVVPIGVVTTVLPGAPAADVEALVTNEIEQALTGTLESVKEITSTSREGVSSIVVEFDASADLDESIQDLKDKVDAVTDLPSDAEEPNVSEVNFVDQPILTYAVSGNLQDDEFVILSDALENELESIRGVSRVEIQGVRTREVNVVVDPALLERFELTITDVSNALTAANSTFPIGQIESDGIVYNIAFEGDIDKPEEVAGVVVTTRGGTPVYVRDIATVTDGLSDRTSLSRLSLAGAPSQQSVSFNVYKQSGGDITDISRRVNEQMVALQAQNELLDNVSVYTAYDAGSDITKDLVSLTRSGFQTVLLVILVLVLAIGWREGLVAGTAIPLSFTIGFIGLYFSGNTINFISLFALILGIGVLVDSGIVMVEGINKRMKDDPTIDKTQAALLAVREFSKPLMSGTLTTVSMFVGLFVVSGVTGQFIASIPFTLIFVLFASMLVALGFLPLIASFFLKRRSETTFEQKQTAYAHKLEAWYRGKVARVLDDKKLQARFVATIIAGFFFSLTLMTNVVAGLIVFPIVYILVIQLFKWRLRSKLSGFIKLGILTFASFIVFGVSLFATNFLPFQLPLVRVVFFESGDMPFLTAEVELPEGSTLEQTDLAIRRVEDRLYENEHIEAFVTTVGSGSAFAGGGTGAKLANIYIGLIEERDAVSGEIVEDLRAATADMRDIKVTFSQPEGGPPTGDPIGIQLLGDDLTTLTVLGNEIAELLKDIDGTTNVDTSTNNNSTEFVFTLNKAKAATLGLTPQGISLALRSAVYGVDATTLTSLTDDIDVVVKLNLNEAQVASSEDANVTSVDTIRNMALKTPSGETVLLSSVADVSVRESSSVINHEDGKRVISVSAGVTTEGNVIEINAKLLERIAAELDVPDDVTISLGGETEESNQAFKEMFYALIVGIVLMVAVLVLQFNSYRHTLYVLSILPFSLIGIMLGLAGAQQTLSFPSIMGFIALTGIIVNNSILLIDMMNHLREKYPEKSIRDVVLDAAASRLRPILLTTITTVVGMIPLLTTDPIWIPLATAIMFGLSFSVVITLVLIPVVYSRKPGGVHHVE